VTFTDLTPRKLALAGFFVCAAMIAFALYLQYVVHLEPCPLCMLQRICYAAIALVFLVGALHGPRKGGAGAYAALAFILAATGIGLASRHVWLQWYPPEESACTADLFFQLQRFPVFNVLQKALRATGDCAVVDWTFLGLSLAQWSWLGFLGLMIYSATIFMRASATMQSSVR
jgi:disulfide bond formation protein DsbB